MDLGAASVAAGAIARRPPVVRLLEATQADVRALRRMRALRSEFGCGPVELAIPGRRVIVLLDPNDVGTVLAEAPDPYDPANREKRKALQWFEPHGVLISRGPIRQARRRVNEAALDTSLPLHRLANDFDATIADEAAAMVSDATARGHLDAAQFRVAFTRLVRRLMFGERARDDETVTAQIHRLRKAANWSFLALPHRRLRDEFTERLYRYVEEPEPGTLAWALAEVPANGAVDPVGQMPQWLFAFDAVSMALLRSLALLATHPAEFYAAAAESDPVETLSVRPYLRACVLESLRLWPTTPMILRDTVRDTVWGTGDDSFVIEKGAGLMIVTPAFHRDDDLLPFAHSFSPEIWLDGTVMKYPQLVPFSGGPAECPGRNLVLFTASTLLAHLLSALDFRLTSTPTLSPDRPLPMTLDPFGVDFAVTPVRESVGR